MIDFIKNPYFSYFFVPLLTTGLGIFVKVVSRNDQHFSFKKEDLAVGLETSVTALIILIADSVNSLTKLNASDTDQQTAVTENLAVVPWIILIFIILLWSVSTIIRKLGWENENELKPFWGIVIPNIFGISSLIFVVIWITN